MHAEMQIRGADAQVDPDPGARPSTGAYYLAAALLGMTIALRDVSRPPRGAVAQETMLSLSGPLRDTLQAAVRLGQFLRERRLTVPST
jgi:hypothetical protein